MTIMNSIRGLRYLFPLLPLFSMTGDLHSNKHLGWGGVLKLAGYCIHRYTPRGMRDLLREPLNVYHDLLIEQM